MKFKNRKFLPLFPSFLMILIWSTLLSDANGLTLEVNNKEIDQPTALRVTVYTDSTRHKREVFSIDVPPTNPHETKPLYFPIDLAKVSRIEATLFFGENLSRTALYVAQDIKFIPLKKLSISLFSSHIKVDVAYNLPPVWGDEG